MLFGKFLMTTTAFLSLEDIADNLPRYDESVLSVEMDKELAGAMKNSKRTSGLPSGRIGQQEPDEHSA